jgi:hypothetical protein
MKRPSLALLLLLIALATLFCGGPSEVPGSAASPSDPVERSDEQDVTEQNLLASERFWPYRVRLNETHPVAGRDEPLPAGLTGVLIRVESSGLPRIDFGSLGKYEIPVRVTDLLARANEIRMGNAQKEEPNFIHAIKARMLDSSSEVLQALRLEETMQRRGFLCVFADPGAEGFDEMAQALAVLRERHGVMTILFPQGTHADPELRERLRALEWPVPFLPDFLAEPYTRTLLVDGTPMPYVMLQTAEGRVLFQRRWGAEASLELVSALDEAFAGFVSARSLADLDPVR